MRDQGLQSTDQAERERVVAELKTVETRAFDMLINEDLAANESFRIFTDLVKRVIDDIRLRNAG